MLSAEICLLICGPCCAKPLICGWWAARHGFVVFRPPTGTGGAPTAWQHAYPKRCPGMNSSRCHPEHSDGNVFPGCPVQILATGCTTHAHCALMTACQIVLPYFGTDIDHSICMPPYCSAMDGLVCAGQQGSVCQCYSAHVLTA